MTEQQALNKIYELWRHYQPDTLTAMFGASAILDAYGVSTIKMFCSPGSELNVYVGSREHVLFPDGRTIVIDT